jgi:phage terminase large subunit
LSTLQIKTAEVFRPLLDPARYKGAHGGRGSGKSHNFADNLVEDSVRFPGGAAEGLRTLCVREVQKSLKQSAKRLIETKLAEHRLGERDGFKIYESVIKTPGDGVIEFQGMQDHTAESVKSFEGFHRAWVEEAQTLSARSLALLRPTIRWEDKRLGLESELWFSWNPRRKTDPVDVMLRGANLPTNATVVRANWSDNPWFPSVLEQERLDCLRTTPDQYDHIWEGGYATVLEGAYYAQALAKCREEGRIGIVGPDPLMTIRLFCDIGGTGAKADAFSIWVAQFVGKQVRILDYYESVGQPLEAHLTWMRSRGYEPDKASIWLPHDGKTNDKVYDVSYESALKQAGYTVEVVPNQGKGAAMARIESARRVFPNVWFNDTPAVESGLNALGWYHEKRDEDRGIGLGPEHDWSSHGADSYGLMAIVYEDHDKQSPSIEDPYAGFRSGTMMI